MGTKVFDYTTHPEGYFPAFHWDGSAESTNALAKFVGDDDTYGKCDFFEIEDEDGETIYVRPGDYVIPDYSGRFAVMSEEAFEDYFTKI